MVWGRKDYASCGDKAGVCADQDRRSLGEADDRWDPLEGEDSVLNTVWNMQSGFADADDGFGNADRRSRGVD